MIPYVKDFYSKAEADALKESVLSQPAIREKNARNGSDIRKLHYGTYSPIPESHYGGIKHCRPLEDGPDYIKGFAAKLSDFAEKQINYISQLGYENEKDHINWHQHHEDHGRKDQSVWVVSLGQVRELALRPKDCNDKSQWEYLYPEHGSLYVLPHEYNITHEHAVLDQEYRASLRICLNCKHLEAEYIEAELAKIAGRKPKPPAKPFVREPGPPRIYNIKSGEFPKDGVYVGRAYGAWPSTPFGNHKRLNGDAWKAEVARLMASPEFAAQVESLRGKDLLCWCGPKEMDHCHARAWLELANAK